MKLIFQAPAKKESSDSDSDSDSDDEPAAKKANIQPVAKTTPKVVPQKKKESSSDSSDSDSSEDEKAKAPAKPAVIAKVAFLLFLSSNNFCKEKYINKEKNFFFSIFSRQPKLNKRVQVKVKILTVKKRRNQQPSKLLSRLLKLLQNQLLRKSRVLTQIVTAIPKMTRCRRHCRQ